MNSQETLDKMAETPSTKGQSKARRKIMHSKKSLLTNYKGFAIQPFFPFLFCYFLTFVLRSPFLLSRYRFFNYVEEPLRMITKILKRAPY